MPAAANAGPVTSFLRSSARREMARSNAASRDLPASRDRMLGESPQGNVSLRIEDSKVQFREFASRISHEYLQH